MPVAMSSVWETPDTTEHGTIVGFMVVDGVCARAAPGGLVEAGPGAVRLRAPGDEPA